MVSPTHLAGEDESREAAVLGEVLRLHPTGLTVTELIRLLGADPSGAFSDADRWRRAICELCDSGLLRLDGEVVSPTFAAVRFAKLFEGP